MSRPKCECGHVQVRHKDGTGACSSRLRTGLDCECKGYEERPGETGEGLIATDVEKLIRFVQLFKGIGPSRAKPLIDLAFELGRERIEIIRVAAETVGHGRKPT